jgi:hypothetical protein
MKLLPASCHSRYAATLCCGLPSLSNKIFGCISRINDDLKENADYQNAEPGETSN